ncbi:hypothetical protein ACTQ5K_02830 [Niallia sp. Sow4_A1]|uniref:hypothetical protein n=1 Tax=Niallia sp. Sow4_A1 TaxID=3438793 RepID=UPI003F988ACE
MSKDVQVFSNGIFELKVRETANSVEFAAEDVAKSLGFTRVVNGKLYVRWERLNGYLRDFGFTHEVGKGDFIAESFVYMLGMRGENDLAIAFQKFIAFEVLPAIRKNKVYIDPSATDQEIDNAVKLATPQKRRKALMDATIDGKDSVFSVYENIKEYIAKWTADDKIKVLQHVERALMDKKDTYGNDVAFVHKVEELLRQVAKDLDKIKNWRNGAEKRELGKENKLLQQKIEELTPPSLDEYFCLPYHPFTENRMYDAITSKKWVKTKAFKDWCDYFPYFLMPDESELNIDWNRPIKLYLAYDHQKKFDVQNFHKSAIDMICKYYGQDDSIINEIEFVNKTINHVKSYKDGKIYFLFTN